MTAYGAGSFYRTKSGYTYNPVSAPLDQDKLWVKYFPYEVAFARNTVSLAYEHYYYFEDNPFLLPKAIELKPSLSFKMTEREKQKDFFRMDLNVNYELKQDVFTVGFGPSLYRDLSNEIDTEFGSGVNVYLDFLNIIRLTYAKRSNYMGDDYHFYVGVNDIPSFLYWVGNH